MADVAGKKHVQISFDDLNRIRILDAEDFKKTEQLGETCNTFTTSVNNFNKVVHSLVEVLAVQSEKIEKEKLLAIGQKNRIESESENRRRQQIHLSHIILQKKAEIQRLQDQATSLAKVEAEQRAMIEKLSKN